MVKYRKLFLDKIKKKIFYLIEVNKNSSILLKNYSKNNKINNSNQN